jgi:hypothetical protein
MSNYRKIIAVAAYIAEDAKRWLQLMTSLGIPKED